MLVTGADIAAACARSGEHLYMYDASSRLGAPSIGARACRPDVYPQTACIVLPVRPVGRPTAQAVADNDEFIMDCFLMQTRLYMRGDEHDKAQLAFNFGVASRPPMNRLASDWRHDPLLPSQPALKIEV